MDEPLYETIRPRTRLLGRRLVHLPSVGSTMDEARRLADEGADSGTVVVADQQTAGRGRGERAWHSPKGSLYATVLLRDEIPLPRLPLLSLMAGLALADSIEKLLRLDARLKWPNDVWIGDKKVAGILIETRLGAAAPEQVLIGLGVNGNLRPEQLPDLLAAQATTLSAEAGRHVCLPALLKIFLERLETIVVDLRGDKVALHLDRVRRRSLVLGRRVRVETTSGPAAGVATAIADDGALVVRTESGERVVNVGDCQLLRPV